MPNRARYLLHVLHRECQFLRRAWVDVRAFFVGVLHRSQDVGEHIVTHGYNKSKHNIIAQYRITGLVTIVRMLYACIIIQAIRTAKCATRQTPSASLSKQHSVTVTSVPRNDNVFFGNAEQILVALSCNDKSDTITPNVPAFPNQNHMQVLHDRGEIDFKAMFNIWISLSDQGNASVLPLISFIGASIFGLFHSYLNRTRQHFCQVRHYIMLCRKQCFEVVGGGIKVTLSVFRALVLILFVLPSMHRIGE